MTINRPSQKYVQRSLLCAFAGFALNGLAQPVQPTGDEKNNQNVPTDTAWKLEKISDYDWTRHFRIGGLAGFNIKSNFKMSGDFNASPNSDGAYDDGYVREDSTGNDGGLTGNWGYKNASQISGSTLLMHQATSFSVGNGNSSDDASPSPGFDLAYGDSYWYWAHAKLGWEFGFGLLPISVAGNASVSVNRNVYGFDISGDLMPPPGYQGGENAAGDTVLIGSAPVSEPNDTVPGTTSENLDVMFYNARLGPTLYWDLSRYIGLYAGVGPAICLVSGDVRASGILNVSDGSTAHYATRQINGTSIVYGGYINATLVYHAVEGGDFYLGAQFMPMSGATFNGNGQSGRLDLGGQIYITAGINWPF